MTECPEVVQIHLRPMTLDDLGQVVDIDRVSFPTPWPRDAFLYELQPNRNSVCMVAEWVNQDGAQTLVGSIVIWLSKEKAHVATLAVRPGYRRRGIAQKLLSRGLLACSRLGVHQAMLEVRASNQAAQQLYVKFGFDVVGLRPGYYKDTHEDGVQMKLAPLQPEKLIDLAGCR